MDSVRFGIIAIAVFGVLWFTAWEFFSRAGGGFNGQLGTTYAERYWLIWVVVAFGAGISDYYARRQKAKKQ